jgi:hypothetical protein
MTVTIIITIPATVPVIVLDHFYCNAWQKYFLSDLTNGLIFAKIKMPKYCKWPWQKKLHDKSWRHMKLFKEEHKLLTLFRTCTRQFQIKSDQKSFHFMKLIDMLNFKNSIWRLIRTRTLNYDMLYFYIDKILNLLSYAIFSMTLAKQFAKEAIFLRIRYIFKFKTIFS